MPRLALTAEELEALTVFVLAHRGARRPPAMRVERTPRQAAIAQGEALVRRFGCRTCHEIGRNETPVLDEGEVLFVEIEPIGGEIRDLYAEPALAPPSLTHAGLRLRYDWLYDYLMAPTPVRPWLPARMPAYPFAPEEAEALVRFFAALAEQPFPFRRDPRPAPSAAERADARWLFEKLQCEKCHQTEGADLAERAPDLALARERLNPAFVRAFLLEPQRLEPGTRMPTLFPRLDDDLPNSHTTPYPERLGGDVQRQVDALTHLTSTFGADRAGGRGPPHEDPKR